MMRPLPVFLFMLGLMIPAIPAPARAEMSKVTVAVVVKSFDGQTVTVRLRQREITLPRKLIPQENLTTGSAIFVTLRGDEIRYLFKHVAAAESGRRPASVNNRPRR